MVSVIVPVYNASKFLKQCLASILSQTYKDLELIIIDDGSIDNSLAICQVFKRKDSRVNIIAKSINEGLEAARKSGLQMASGEWVMFVDADDRLSDSHVLEKCVELASLNVVDMLQFGTRKISPKGIIKKRLPSFNIGVIEQPELIDKYYISFFGYSIFPCSMWGKLWKKSVLDSIKIKQVGIFMWEDEAFHLQIFPHLRRIYVTDMIGYDYRIGGGSSRYFNYLDDYLKLYQLKKEMIRKYDYHKADDFIRWELKNVFRTDLLFKIRRKLSPYNTSKSLLQYVKQVLAYPDIIEACSWFEANGRVDECEPFFKAMIENKPEEVLDYIESLKKKTRLKNFISLHLLKWL